MKDKNKKEPIRKCRDCGSTVDVIYGPDPFNSEINGDETPMWECASCRHESAIAI